MRRLLVLSVLMVAAAVLPTVATPLPAADALDCVGGVAVEGRCLSVDDQASLCSGAACIEFVEESVDFCAEGTLDGASCTVNEPAVQRDPDCPEGARGEVTACFIYVAIGPAGCPPPSTLDASGNCRRPVGDAQGAFFCEREAAVLLGGACTTTIDPVPSPCPAGTTRFDSACWRLNGLTSPETCDGHAAVGTVQLASGRCRVPIAIPTGSSTCTGGATYHQYPSYLLINGSGMVQGQGPTDDACVDASVSVGIAVTSCFFLDDDLPWGNYGDPGLCTRFDAPVVMACPSGFTIDDSLGGACARFEPTVSGACPNGGQLSGRSCVFVTDFEAFDCPGGMERNGDTSICVAYRPVQNALTCTGVPSLLGTVTDPEFGLQYGCLAHVGPQPDTCNALGTLDMCFEIREPIAVPCNTASGCVMFRLLGDISAGYVPVTPVRIVDSRSAPSLNTGPFNSPWGPGTVRSIDATTALSGVPANATAVAVHVTSVADVATGPAFGWLTIFPTGTSRPTAASITYGTADVTAPITNDLVITKIDSDGHFEIYNEMGTADLVIDLVGYYSADPAAASYVAIVPDRIIDSRPGQGNEGPFATQWAANESRVVNATAAADVPAGVSAVALHVTTVNADAPFSWLTAFPSDAARPVTASIVYGTTDVTTPIRNDLVITGVDSAGNFTLYNHGGRTDIVIDIVGFYTTAQVAESARYRSINPQRIIDSRSDPSLNIGPFSMPWSAGQTLLVDATTTQSDVPDTATAVAVHVTTVNASAPLSWLTIYPAGAARPTAASINYGTLQLSSPITNDLVLTKIDAEGNFEIYNEAGATDIVIDIVGYFE